MILVLTHHLGLLFVFNFPGLGHSLVVYAVLDDSSLEVFACETCFNVHFVVKHRSVQKDGALKVELGSLFNMLHLHELTVDLSQDLLFLLELLISHLLGKVFRNRHQLLFFIQLSVNFVKLHFNLTGVLLVLAPFVHSHVVLPHDQVEVVKSDLLKFDVIVSDIFLLTFQDRVVFFHKLF